MASGCHLGNYTEDPPPSQNNPDFISGYYLSRPQSIRFYASTYQNSTHQAEATLSFIPAEISGTMSNPVILMMQDLQLGTAVLATSNGRNPLPVSVHPDLSLSESWSTTPRTYWNDPRCQTYLEVSETGAVTQDPSTPPPPNFGHSILGTIQIRFQVITQFIGSCQPTFQALANCYQDLNQCGGTDGPSNIQIQNQVLANFDALIQLKLITPADIPNIVNYAYEASYL